MNRRPAIRRLDGAKEIGDPALVRIFHPLLPSPGTFVRKYRLPSKPLGLSGQMTKPPVGFVFRPHCRAIVVETPLPASTGNRTKHFDGEKYGLAGLVLDLVAEFLHVLPESLRGLATQRHEGYERGTEEKQDETSDE